MEGKADYIAFMPWLQKNHPESHTYCCYYITVATDGEGVTIDKDGLDPITYKTLVSVTQAYYRNEHQKNKMQAVLVARLLYPFIAINSASRYSVLRLVTGFETAAFTD